ncbi:hypothetical protein Tco_1395061 [Tanacetum coccineum]
MENSNKLNVREGTAGNHGAIASGAFSVTTVGDLDVLTKDIKTGKHEELLSGMTYEKRKAIMDALVAIFDLIEAENTYLTSTCPTGSIQMDTAINADAIPYKVLWAYQHWIQASLRKIFDPYLQKTYDGVQFSILRKVFETGFVVVLAVLITGTSQSRQHGSHKSPITVLFDVDTGRISIRHCEMLKSITLSVLAISQG